MRLYETGFEMGTSPFDVGSISVVSSQSPGPWSTYQGQGGGVPSHTLDGAQVSELYHGFRFMYTSPSYGRMINYVSPNGTQQTSLSFNNPSGLLFFARNDGSVVLGTGTHLLQTNVWYYIEVYQLIHDTTGAFQVKVNGMDEIPLTSGVDTRNDGSSDKIDRIQYIRDYSSHYIDDIYVNDPTGGINDGFSGDIAVMGFSPNAAGDVTQLTRGGSDSGNNYGQVDERPANDSTDYVYGTAADQYDLYNIPAASASFASVQSARLWMRGAKDGAGTAAVAAMLKADTDANGVADTEYQAADQSLGNGYQYDAREYDQQPDATSWTPAKIDALQIGVKVR